MATETTEKSAKSYARQFNRIILHGGSLYYESPLGEPPSGLINFRTRKNVLTRQDDLLGLSTRTGKWIPIRPESVKNATVESFEEERTMRANKNQNTADVTDASPSPAQHTPTPWQVEGATKIWHIGKGYGAIAIIADPECKNSGDFKEVDPTCARWDEAMGNMDLIIKAVNSHEALVEAVKLALTTPGMIKGRDALEAALRMAEVN